MARRTLTAVGPTRPAQLSDRGRWYARAATAGSRGGGAGGGPFPGGRGGVGGGGQRDQPGGEGQKAQQRPVRTHAMLLAGGHGTGPRRRGSAGHGGSPGGEGGRRGW